MSGIHKQAKLLVTLALAASFSVSAAIANPLKLGGNKQAPGPAPSAATTPEIEAAAAKVDQLHAKLEQAKNQLEAAKANLKAAESELKAAKADKEALSMRNEATLLASKAAVTPPVKSSEPVTSAPAAPVAAAEPAATADAPTVHQLDSNGINTTPLPTNGTAPTLQDLAPSNVP